MLPYKLVNWIYSWKNWLIRKIQMSMYSWLLNVLICAQNLCNFLLFQKSFQYPELRNGRINIKGKTGLEKYFGSIHDWTLIQLNVLKLPPVLVGWREIGKHWVLRKIYMSMYTLATGRIDSCSNLPQFSQTSIDFSSGGVII